MTKRYNLEDLIDAYNLLVKGIDEDAYEDDERAYGGIIRAGKGMFVESITKELVKIAWHDLGGDLNDLNFNKKKIKIPIKKDYVDNLKVKEVKDYIYEHLSEYNYGLSVDDFKKTLDSKLKTVLSDMNEYASILEANDLTTLERG